MFVVMFVKLLMMTTTMFLLTVRDDYCMLLLLLYDDGIAATAGAAAAVVLLLLCLLGKFSVGIRKSSNVPIPDVVDDAFLFLEAAAPATAAGLRLSTRIVFCICNFGVIVTRRGFVFEEEEDDGRS